MPVGADQGACAFLDYILLLIPSLNILNGVDDGEIIEER